MKRLLITTLFAAAALSGCATVGSNGALVIANGIAGLASDALKPPMLVQKYMAFADKEDLTVSAVITAQKIAGYKPAGKLETITFQKATPLGVRSYKVEIAGEAAFQVPLDALAKRSPALTTMLRSFGGYIGGRPEPTQIIVAAASKAEVDYMQTAIKSGAAGLQITPVVKDVANPFISFVSKGGTAIRRLP